MSNNAMYESSWRHAMNNHYVSECCLQGTGTNFGVGLASFLAYREYLRKRGIKRHKLFGRLSDRIDARWMIEK